MNFYNHNNQTSQYVHQHRYSNNGYHHHHHQEQPHPARNHHRNHHFYHEANHHSNHHHYNHGNHYESHFNPQYPSNIPHHTSFPHHHYHNPHNPGANHHPYRHPHPRTHHNAYRHYPPPNTQRPQHEILSTRTETLTFTKKVRKAPIFYDPESEIARKCNEIKKRFEHSMFEEEEKERLLHFERCSLIREHELQRADDDESEDKPVTPSASECSDNDNATDVQKEKQIGGGAVMRNRRVSNIWETTQDHVMIDAHGRNLLDNDRADTAQFGIYHADGIKQQAMIVPDAPTIDGQYIANHAKSVTKKKTKKKNEMNHNNKKKKKTRRGGKGKGNKQSKAPLTQQELDQMKANELVAYLELCRNSSM